MFKNLTNFANLLRNAGQLAPKLQSMKNQLAHRRVHGSAGDGDVYTTFDGMGRMDSVRIADHLYDPARRSELESLLTAAVNDGIREARKLHIEAVREVVGDLDIPGIDQLIEELSE